MKQEAKEKNLRLSYIPKDIPYTIVGDYYKISNILKYLITNAIEYNAKGAITVTVNPFDKAHQEVKYDKPKEVVLEFIIKSTTPILSKEEEQLIYCYNKNSVSI
ncbi:hypothetical protein [Rickettsia gravesii]|uniref:hypothetical protein n=1 Tax=Rickettsia gravesii TaxID=354585 RepID=UPI00036499A7|nr:hypothetical protein [Rickettsia gravesii]